jgi:hypothetical protein
MLATKTTNELKSFLIGSKDEAHFLQGLPMKWRNAQNPRDCRSNFLFSRLRAKVRQHTFRSRLAASDRAKHKGNPEAPQLGRNMNASISNVMC